MNSQIMKSFAASASLLLTIAVGAPAFADDTEILIVDPAASAATPPNILFILDTSGSMGDAVKTTEPYDSTVDYNRTGATCDGDKLYWTILDVEPSCARGNSQNIAKTAFQCEDARLRMTGIGAYTGVLVQYRGGAFGVDRWQEMEIGNDVDMVECQNDSGEHGEGTAGQVYAKAGTSGVAFTAVEGEELEWGSGNATQVYTIYDGNYLNWKEVAEEVDLPKMDILKAVTRNLLNAVENVNVGVMRFSGGSGGRIIHGISDLDTDRTAIIDEIQGLTAAGVTPLAETLYEAALYWQGLTPRYGNFTGSGGSQSPADVDPAAFVAGMPGQYQAPAMPSCTRNFNVLLTDGMPVNDDGAQALTPTLPGFTAETGLTECLGDGQGRCLDEIGEYMFKRDLTPDTTELPETTVITHTIGFGFDEPLDIMVETALDSGGQYFPADNVETLTSVLMRIVEIALDKGLSFSAPAVAVNTFNRTQNLNDLYIATFSPQARVHWPGNLKKYTLSPTGEILDGRSPGLPAVDPGTGFFKDSARSFWTPDTVNDGANVTKGGAAGRLPDPDDRRLFTNYGASDNLIADSNAIDAGNTALQLADFGLTGAPGEPTLDELIRWARGEDVLDVDQNTDTTVRYVMGDALHSQPAAVVYGGDPDDPDIVVFTATNDGYFHAIDGDTGVELWSFIPKQLLQDLPSLMLDGVSTYKHYGIDGDIVPVVKDENNNGIVDGDDFVHVIFGMRRGGTQFFSLDVTNKNNPSLNWVVSYPEFGQSWSRPVVARVDMNSSDLNDDKAVVIIGEGYDTVHDTPALPATDDNVGAGISMLDLFSGERVWRAGRDSGNSDLTIAAMTRSFPSAVRVIDFSGDGFIDRMYAVDVGGQVFRFDVSRAMNPANTVTGGVIARFGGEGVASAGDTATRRFYSAPDVSIFSDPVLNRRFLAIGVGSGYRAHPLDTSAEDAYFSLRDPYVFTKLTADQYSSFDVAEAADLAEVSGQVNTVIGNDDRGWKFTVPAGQMILSSSATFDNSVFFISYAPDASSATSCEVKPGSNFLYRVNVANGDPVANNLDTMDPEDSNTARITALEQGGIAPTPAFLFPSGAEDCDGHDCAPPPIGCVGVECFDPGFENNPVRTLWTQDGIE